MKENKKTVNKTTVLGKDIEFKGILKFDGFLQINGNFEGEISAEKGELVIGKNATVKAKILAKDIYNMGKIIGDVYVANILSISEEAELFGNFNSNTLIVQHGGIINGQCTMKQKNSVE